MAGTLGAPPQRDQAPRHRARPLVGGLLASLLLVGVAACGDDEALTDEPTTSTSATSSTTAADDGRAATSSSGSAPSGTSTSLPEGPTVEVTMVDHAFEGLPPTTPVGTHVHATNASTTEAHELIAMRISDGETRSVEELVALPDEDLLAAMARPVADVVTVAGPGEEGAPGGEYEVLEEPGRYIVFCQIPIGADPAAILGSERYSSGRFPPEYDGLPTHASEGMVAEVEVT